MNMSIEQPVVRLSLRVELTLDGGNAASSDMAWTTTVCVNPDDAIRLANLLTDAVDQLDRRT